MRRSNLYLLSGMILLTFSYQNCGEVAFNKVLTSMGVDYFIWTPSSIVGEAPTVQIKTLDWNQNGKVDVIFTYKKGSRYDSTDVSPRLCLDVDVNNFSNCHRLKEALPESGIGRDNDTVWITDIDGDGRDDVVLFNVGKSYILFNRGMKDGGPQYDRVTFYDGEDRLIGTVTDLNHNGKPDLAYVRMYINSGRPNTSHLHIVYDVSANGSFTPAIYTLPNASRMANNEVEGPHTVLTVELFGVDTNGDGKKELFIKNQRTEPHYVMGFSPASVALMEIDKGDRDYYLDGYLSAGDLNGDGIDDILMPSHSRDGPLVLLSNGSGYVESSLSLGLNKATRAVLVKDYNNDGILDVVSLVPASNGSFELFVNFGLGNLEFSEPTYMMTSVPNSYFELYIPLAAWDMDGNGMLDMMVGSRGEDVKALMFLQSH